MITHVELTLKTKHPESYRPDWAWGLYGFLCEIVGNECADCLHQQAITPLRQNLQLNAARDRFVWSLDLLDDSVSEKVVPILSSLEHLPLEKSPEPLEVEGCSVASPVGLPQLLERANSNLETFRSRLFFASPTGFKSEEQYVLFPTAELIAKSAMMRWNACFPEYPIEDEDAVRMLLDGIWITSYNLRSTNYTIKGNKIPGFVGSVTINSRLAAPLKEIWNMLMAFVPYAGVGIKTALGMGAVQAFQSK